MVCTVLLVIFLCGCGNASALDKGMKLRNELLQSAGCDFNATVTADYGEKTYTFVMHCQTDSAGTLAFSVTEPVTIAGIEGTVDEMGGKLTFRDKALAFPNIADGLISPVAAPWLFVHGMTGGYLKASEQKDDGIHIVIDESYRNCAVQIDLYCDNNNIPVRGEILWEGRRIITIDVTDFTIR